MAETEAEIKFTVGERKGMEAVNDSVLRWHEDAETRFGRPTFHGSEHIRSVMAASEPLIKENGPIDLRRELEKYNEGKLPEQQASVNDLRDANRWHQLLHDSGNVVAGIVPEGDVLRLKMQPGGFKAAGAEDRSKAIEELMIPGAVDSEQAARLVPLTKQLTEVTKFGASLQEPFAQVVQVIDQVGTHLFRNDRPRAVRGLLEEMAAENPDATIRDPDTFFNFPQRRLVQLVPDDTQRQAVLNAWNKPMPDEISGLGELGPLKVQDILGSESLRTLLKLD